MSSIFHDYSVKGADDAREGRSARPDNSFFFDSPDSQERHEYNNAYANEQLKITADNSRRAADSAEQARLDAKERAESRQSSSGGGGSGGSSSDWSAPSSSSPPVSFGDFSSLGLTIRTNITIAVILDCILYATILYKPEYMGPLVIFLLIALVTDIGRIVWGIWLVLFIVSGLFSCNGYNFEFGTQQSVPTRQQPAQQPRQTVDICVLQAKAEQVVVSVENRAGVVIQTFQSYQPAGRSCIIVDRGWFNPAVIGGLYITNSYRTAVIGRGLTALYNTNQAHSSVDACLSESCLPHKKRRK